MALGTLLSACMLAGCKDNGPSGQDRTPPAVAYTVDESLVGTADANDTRFYAPFIPKERVISNGGCLISNGSSS